MPDYEVTVYYEADDARHADELFDAMLDGLGCSEKCMAEPCPHFRLSIGPSEAKYDEEDVDEEDV